MINTKPLIKFLLWTITLFLVCIIGVSGVFAWTNWNGITYDEIGAITNKTSVMIDVSYETESGAPLSLSADQLVYTQLKKLYINVDNYNFSANTRYELEIYLPNMQLNNNANSYIVTGYNGESCLVSYSDSIFVDHYPRWDFQCPTATNTISIVIFNSNNQNITDKNNFSWNYSYLYSSITPITNSGANNNNDLITNANQNADRIIDNQNQNTQKIIDNQNENTDKEIESNRVCEYIDKESIITNGKYLGLTGILGNNDNTGITDYINIEKASLKMINKYNYSILNYCFYDVNKSLISCYFTNEDNYKITIPNNSVYVRFSIYKPQNKPTFQICRDGNQALNDSINNLNDSINNDNVDENGVADAFENFNDYLDDNSTITQLITLPITLYTAILNNLNGSCTPFNLGSLYGENLVLPCINISQYLGNSLWTMIDIIISGFAVYSISKKMIKIFNNFSSLREGDVIDD